MKKTFIKPVILGVLLLGSTLFFLYSMTELLLALPRWQYLLSILIVSFIFGFLYRRILKSFAGKPTIRSNKNIDTNGRGIRAISGIVLLVIAISTTWSPFLLFFAGFCFFEAIFSRCGLYAALGKSSCPV